MAKARYPISREFLPFSLFTPPMGRGLARLAQKLMKTPKWRIRERSMQIQSIKIPGFRAGEIELIVFSPEGIGAPSDALVYYHGGGFVFEGHVSHYAVAKRYAREAGCRVIYVRYRLAPEHPFPFPQEDCWRALMWVYDHAGEIGIDSRRIGVAGDSAGGTLAAVCCMMARDRCAPVRPLFQMLIYPWLDERDTSPSRLRFTDTPMWNTKLCKKTAPIINPRPEDTPLAYRSPMQAESHEGLAPAYIETAEFDCLRDDGEGYAALLKNAGVAAEYHEVKGAMHGFDAAQRAPTAQKMMEKRISFLKRMFGK